MAPMGIKALPLTEEKPFKPSEARRGNNSWTEKIFYVKYVLSNLMKALKLRSVPSPFIEILLIYSSAQMEVFLFVHFCRFMFADM